MEPCFIHSNIYYTKLDNIYYSTASYFTPQYIPDLLTAFIVFNAHMFCVELSLDNTSQVTFWQQFFFTKNAINLKSDEPFPRKLWML